MRLRPVFTASGLVLLASPISLAVAQETTVDDRTGTGAGAGHRHVHPSRRWLHARFPGAGDRERGIRGACAEDRRRLLHAAALQLQHHVHGGPRAGFLERLRQPEPAQPRRRRHAGAAELAARGARRGHSQQRRRQFAGAADRDRAHRCAEGRRLVAVRLRCRRRRRELPHPQQLRGLRSAGASATCASTATAPTTGSPASGVRRPRTRASWSRSEYFNRAPFTWETYEIIRDRPGIDGAFRLAGWPARYSLPNRNAAGALLTGAAGATTIADPLCAQFAPSANTTGTPVTRLGVTYPTQLPAERTAGHERQRGREPLPGLRRGASRVQPRRCASSVRRASCARARHSSTRRAPPRIPDRASPP